MQTSHTLLLFPEIIPPWYICRPRQHFSKPPRPRPMILFDCCRSRVLTRTPIHFIPIPRLSPLLRSFLVHHSGPAFIKLIRSYVLIAHFLVAWSGWVKGKVEGNLFIRKWDATLRRRQHILLACTPADTQKRPLSLQHGGFQIALAMRNRFQWYFWFHQGSGLFVFFSFIDFWDKRERGIQRDKMPLHSLSVKCKPISSARVGDGPKYQGPFMPRCNSIIQSGHIVIGTKLPSGWIMGRQWQRFRHELTQENTHGQMCKIFILWRCFGSFPPCSGTLWTVK